MDKFMRYYQVFVWSEKSEEWHPVREFMWVGGERLALFDTKERLSLSEAVSRRVELAGNYPYFDFKVDRHYPQP